MEEWLPKAGRPAVPTTRGEYEAAFARILDAISAGEIYQANLSRRLAWNVTKPPAELYRRVRKRQPVPEGSYLDLGPLQILCNSPESFVRINGDRISTFPIKGTRPRGTTEAEDLKLREELATDAKEGAEHVMIVDLERNDLGRICRNESVQVVDLAKPHTFETLHHLITEVRGRLRPDIGTEDILRALFPGGSITGAPKVQAMRVIAEVERTRRGVYTGVIGCMNGGRAMDLAIAIRTGIHRDGVLHYSSGGGIVADSRVDWEWKETEIKATAMQSVLEGDAA